MSDEICFRVLGGAQVSAAVLETDAEGNPTAVVCPCCSDRAERQPDGSMRCATGRAIDEFMADAWRRLDEGGQP